MATGGCDALASSTGVITPTTVYPFHRSGHHVANGDRGAMPACDEDRNRILNGFSTVGFGDITPKSDLARTLVTVQMLVNLVVIGLVAKVIFGAVDTGLKKRTAEHHESPRPPAADRT